MGYDVSVIMGVYNDKTYLEQAIESVLSQSMKRFEFIICDDGSTDGSSDVLKRYASKDERIVVIINERNMGLAATLNRCIKESRGKYIARMDSDDVMKEHRLKRQLEFMEEHSEFSVVGSGVEYINRSGNVYKKLLLPQTIDLTRAVRGFCVVHPSVMMKKEPVVSVGGYSVNKNTTRAEDYDLWCKILESGMKIANIQEYLLCYREDIDGMRKRKYKFRIQEYRLKKYWMKRTNQPITSYIFAFKPLIVGLIPHKLMKKIKSK